MQRSSVVFRAEEEEQPALAAAAGAEQEEELARVDGQVEFRAVDSRGRRPAASGDIASTCAGQQVLGAWFV
jgi:hypothetical protein